MKRIFLAIDLPKDIIDGLKKHPDRFLPVRWTEPSNLHVTMNFLGDLEDMELETALQIVEEVCSRHAPIKIELKSIRPFHSMIWAHTARNPELEKIYRELSDAFSSVGIGQSQRSSFKGHITLARARNAETVANFKPVALSGMNFTATHIVVFESQLETDGPTYISVDAFELTPLIYK
ncbi:MAG: RNA 2',3'-cyclic phosphodiesterase [Patescibacteria group bacterium]